MKLHIIRKQEIESTSTYLCDLAAQGYPEGTIVIAQRQTNGRGRQGKSWVSEEGNLYFSWLLRPHLPFTITAQLSFVISLAIAKALEEPPIAVSNLLLKWPNDILVEGKKICGILLESIGGTEVCEALVVGVGLNVAHAPQLGEYSTTYLQAHCPNTPPLSMLFSKIIRSIWSNYIEWQRLGFALVRQDWLARSYPLGQTIEVATPKQQLQGLFKGIDDTGLLILATPDCCHFINSGEVFF